MSTKDVEKRTIGLLPFLWRKIVESNILCSIGFESIILDSHFVERLNYLA